MFKRLILLISILFLSWCNMAISKDIYTVDKAVNEAISNSYIIKEAIQNQKAALNQYRSSVSDLFPKVNFSYNYTYLKDYPYSISNEHKIKVGEKKSVEWNITITQPIFTGFAIITKKEIAKLGLNISRLERKKAILDVAQNVKIAYMKILLAKKYLKVAEEEVKNLKAHVKDAKNLYDTGVIAYNDLLKSQVALSNAIQTKINAENNLKLAISSFNLALRKNINADTDVEDILSIKPHNYSLNNLIKQAMQKRPILQELKLQLKQSRLGIRLAKSEYYPQISAFAQYKKTGRDILANKNDLSNKHNSMVGIQMNWKIFEFGKRSFNTQEQYHKTLALKEKINSIKDNIKLEVKQSFLDLDSARHNIKVAQDALKQAKENYRITTLQYQQQITTSTEVLDANSYLTQAETNYYNALYGYYVALAKLKRTIGEK